MKFDPAQFLRRAKEILDAADPECRAWWAQQPEDLVEAAFQNLDEYVEKYGDDANACGVIAEIVLTDLAMYVRFHRCAKAWVESHEIMSTETNKLLSWRLRSPSTPLALAGGKTA